LIQLAGDDVGVEALCDNEVFQLPYRGDFKLLLQQLVGNYLRNHALYRN